MGGTVTKDGSPKTSVPETKLEAKILEVMRKREVEGSSLKSFNSIILKFPKIDQSFRKCRATFEEFDEDKNGAIDPQELKHCFHKMEIDFSDEEINDLFEACDINEHMAINFNEFIVLLCLVYLLKEDKNMDGYVSKNEMVGAINETTSGERSSGRIAMKRFEEMDWDKNGMVNFKEFLFAFTHWVGIEDIEDDEE